MLDEDSILQANDVSRDPVHWKSYVGEPAVNNDVVAFRQNHPRLILERRRGGLDQVEQAVASRLDVGAVLNVFRGPKSLRTGIVSLIEEGIECLQYDRF